MLPGGIDLGNLILREFKTFIRSDGNVEERPQAESCDINHELCLNPQSKSLLYRDTISFTSTDLCTCRVPRSSLFLLYDKGTCFKNILILSLKAQFRFLRITKIYAWSPERNA